jgi:hypothetical protein
MEVGRREEGGRGRRGMNGLTTGTSSITSLR